MPKPTMYSKSVSPGIRRKMIAQDNKCPCGNALSTGNHYDVNGVLHCGQCILAAQGIKIPES